MPDTAGTGGGIPNNGSKILNFTDPFMDHQSVSVLYRDTRRIVAPIFQPF
jgi:hypothetical protein